MGSVHTFGTQYFSAVLEVIRQSMDVQHKSYIDVVPPVHRYGSEYRSQKGGVPADNALIFAKLLQ